MPELGKELIAIDKCREDALRYLNPYHCNICGKRFGKRFGKERHEKKKNPCVPDGNYKPVSSGLQKAVSELEIAKGYKKVIAAIDKCKNICGEFFSRKSGKSRVISIVITTW